MDIIKENLISKSITRVEKLVEQQVKLNPNAIAVSYGDDSISYLELNSRANQLAHYLIKLGIEPEEPIGIFLERSVNLVVVVLAILKAGGGYVPFEEGHPKEHNAFLIEDAKIRMVVTEAGWVEKIPLKDGKHICMDTNEEEIESCLNTNIDSENKGSDLAYVLYTSGSTGNANGVCVQHDSLINAYFAWEASYHLKDGIINHLQMAKLTFDVFTGDMLRALGSGGRLVLCPKENLLDPKKLYQLITDEEIHCAEFVPAVLRKLISYLETINAEPFEFVKLLICASDNWSMGEYRRFLKFCQNDTRLINSYGLTETTIDSTFFECDEAKSKKYLEEQGVPIGKPFHNTKVYVLDNDLKVVNAGVMGDIYIAGPGLAREYLNRPALNESRFIKLGENHPLGKSLFKTGDVGRVLPDGNVELMGRVDNQVKIRGCRVELTGIENTLNNHPDVHDSLVKIFEDEFGHKRLVAYVVKKLGHTLGIMNVRKFIQDRLPDYMIPATMMEIASLPLTKNGKLDRQAQLPLPINALEASPDNIPPSTEAEVKVLEVWKEVLQRENIGIFDNFFNLGGDSILLAQITIKISEHFGVDINIMEIMNLATVYQQASLIEQKRIDASLLVKVPEEEVVV